MAKAKSKLQKLQEEELTQINSIRNEASQIFFELGRIAIRRRNVNLQIDNDEEKLENQHDDLVKRESASLFNLLFFDKDNFKLYSVFLLKASCVKLLLPIINS